MILTLEECFAQDLSSKTIVFPTDTVYGLGCLLGDEIAIERIFEIKGRDYSKPLAILAPSFESLIPLVRDIHKLEKINKMYWPGALTVVTYKTDKVSDLTTAGNNTVGVRIPNHEAALAILAHFGPMVVTSLNLSSMPAILKFNDCLAFENQVDFIVNGGDLSNQSSTVYDLINHKTLRQGEIVVELEKELE